MPVYRQGIKIHGFFQSETYFKDFKPQIKELFRPNPDTLSHLRTKYSLDKSLGIHVRRGDYINYPFHFLPLSYYDRAIHLAEPHRQLVICSNDLDYCRQAFRGVNCIFSRERDELGDFYLLAACDQQIIANSTFSWWSSFLSDSTQLAIAPGQWQANQQGLIDIQLADHLRPI